MVLIEKPNILSHDLHLTSRYVLYTVLAHFVNACTGPYFFVYHYNQSSFGDKMAYHFTVSKKEAFRHCDNQEMEDSKIRPSYFSLFINPYHYKSKVDGLCKAIIINPHNLLLQCAVFISFIWLIVNQ